MSARSWAVVAVLAVVGAVAMAPAAVQAASKPNPLADPPANTSPSGAFRNACQGMGKTKAANAGCDAAALKDFDAVRVSEGMGPMVLPRDFASLSVPSQLLAISNIERVDRGLVPIAGRSSSLDDLAQTGANTDQDPQFPQPCNCEEGGANWAAAGNSVLLDDFVWMYDDGLNSGNADCTQADMSGCWVHRHDIIGGYEAPVVMGAAVAYNTSDGTSMATEALGGDSTDAVDVAPTWATIAATMPVGLSATRVKVVTHNGKHGHATVKVRAYVHTKIKVAVTSGNKSWSVTPGSCTLAAGATCTLHLAFHSAKAGTHHGKLQVTGPVRDRTVKLIGRRTH